MPNDRCGAPHPWHPQRETCRCVGKAGHDGWHRARWEPAPKAIAREEWTTRLGYLQTTRVVRPLVRPNPITRRRDYE
jgi:hypothetical protein